MKLLIVLKNWLPLVRSDGKSRHYDEKGYKGKKIKLNQAQGKKTDISSQFVNLKT